MPGQDPVLFPSDYAREFFRSQKKELDIQVNDPDFAWTPFTPFLWSSTSGVDSGPTTGGTTRLGMYRIFGNWVFIDIEVWMGFSFVGSWAPNKIDLPDEIKPLDDLISFQRQVPAYYYDVSVNQLFWGYLEVRDGHNAFFNYWRSGVGAGGGITGASGTPFSMTAGDKLHVYGGYRHSLNGGISNGHF